MEKSYKTHQCKLLPDTGVYVSTAKNDNSTWILTIQREATEDDLEENHYLDDIGDIIWTTELEIICCPFCGEKLPDLEIKESESYGNFRHIDSRGWSSEVL